MKNEQSMHGAMKRKLIAAGLAAALVVSAPVTCLALSHGQTTTQDQAQTSVAYAVATSTNEAQTSKTNTTTKSATGSRSKKVKRKLSKGEKAVKTAKQNLGKPYSYGASGPNSFDCSGFTMYVYGKQGVKLTHNAQAQYSEGEHVSKGELKKGDLVFFGSSTGNIYHVGMYVGNGKYIHAPRTGENVKIVSLSDSYNYVGACRVA